MEASSKEFIGVPVPVKVRLGFQFDVQAECHKCKAVIIEKMCLYLFQSEFGNPQDVTMRCADCRHAWTVTVRPMMRVALEFGI